MPRSPWRPPHGRNLIVGLALAVGTAAVPVSAQEPEPEPRPPSRDTVRVEEGIPSPRGAFIRSLVLPGWGQAWVGAPVRGGLYFAMEAGALWMTFKSRRLLREARLEEAWMRETGQLGPTQRSDLATSRRAQAEDWTTVAIFLLFFAGADAFVAAHLADFGDHVGVVPEVDGGFRFEANLPVGGQR